MYVLVNNGLPDFTLLFCGFPYSVRFARTQGFNERIISRGTGSPKMPTQTANLLFKVPIKNVEALKFKELNI